MLDSFDEQRLAGSGASMRELVISSDVQLASGDPELRHLVVDATTGEGPVSYQVLVGATAKLKRAPQRQDRATAYNPAPLPRRSQ